MRRMALAIIAIAVVCLSVSAFGQTNQSVRRNGVPDPSLFFQYRGFEVVQRGMTLWAIAVSYDQPGIAYKILKEINKGHIYNENLIFPGDIVFISNDWVAPSMPGLKPVPPQPLPGNVYKAEDENLATTYPVGDLRG